MVIFLEREEVKKILIEKFGEANFQIHYKESDE
jgi:hypothetical protein